MVSVVCAVISTPVGAPELELELPELELPELELPELELPELELPELELTLEVNVPGEELPKLLAAWVDEPLQAARASATALASSVNHTFEEACFISPVP